MAENKIKHGAELAIGIDVGGSAIKAALVNSAGKILKEENFLMENVTTPQGVVNAVAGVVKNLQVFAKTQKLLGKIIGVGVGVPGPLNPAKGIIYTTPNLPFKKPFAFGAAVKNKIKLPVAIQNDANVAALGETWLGAARGAKVAVMLTLGSGVGGGIVINGKIFDGANGQGAELGHFIFDSHSNKKCGAGHVGCFEAFANRNEMALTGQKLFGAQIKTALDVHIKAEQGNKIALKYFDDYGKMLGPISAYLLNVFNPDVLIFGGALSGSFRFFETGLKKATRAGSFESIFKQVKIKKAVLGNKAGIIGAAALAFRSTNK